MKFVIQRVQHASVTVDNEVIGKIGKGFMVLIGVSEEDNTEIADKMIKKLIGMRIFEDENGDFSVYFICRLQKGKSPVLYQGRKSGARKQLIRIYHCCLPKRGSCSRDWKFWR